MNLERVVEQYHVATGEFTSGNPEPIKAVFSHRGDVTLAVLCAILRAEPPDSVPQP